MAESRIWKPTYKQESFVSLPDTIFEALYGGSVGSGKSELLVVLPLMRNFHLHHKFKGIILRRTFPELEKEIIIRSEDYYTSFGAKYNKQDKVWKFPSGARMFFGHAENEQDIRRYDGVEYNYIAYDELTSFTEWQYLYLSATRCRSSSPDLPAIVRNSAMPGGVGSSWVRKRFVEPCIEGGKVLLDVKSGQKRFFLPSKPHDNPHLLRNDPGYLSRLEILPEAEKRAKFGDWFVYQGQVFDNFRIAPLHDEPANAQHVIEPFEIPDYWPKICSVDWGFTANTAAYWGAISPNGRVYVYREYVVTQTPVAEWATEIGDFCKQDKVKKLILDTNAWDQRGEEKTIAQQVKDFSGIEPEQASKGRVSGKMLIQEYLRWKQKPKPKPIGEFDSKYADAILKYKGLDAYNRYVESFAPVQDEDNIPKLQIFNTCVKLIKTLPDCVYDLKNTEDVAEFPGDDVYDSLRYLLKGIVRFIGESKTYFDQIRKLDEINQRLVQTKDFTSYNLTRARIEYAAIRGKQPIKRFHKASKMRNVRDFADLIRG